MGKTRQPQPVNPAGVDAAARAELAAAHASQAAADLRAAVREAHETIQDVRALRTELRKLTEDGLPAAVTALVEDAVRGGLDGFGQSLKAGLEGSERQMQRRVDLFIAAVLGEDAAEGSLEDALKRHVDRVRLLEAQGRPAAGGSRIRTLTITAGERVECGAGQRMRMAGLNGDNPRLEHADGTPCDHPGDPVAIRDDSGTERRPG
jgi:hypothetical protein